MKRADKKLDPEKVFRALLKQEGIPQPISEYRFAPPRRWRFDYAWIVQTSERVERGVEAHCVALEVEGGIFIQGRHSRGAGMLKDMEKYNKAATMGWLVLRCTPSELNTSGMVDLIRAALKLHLYTFRGAA